MTTRSGAPDLRGFPGDLFEPFDRVLLDWRPSLTEVEHGRVVEVSSGIAIVTGFPNARDGEVIRFPDGLLGFAADLDEHRLGVILLGDETRLQVGMEARRLHRVLDVPVGRALLGRIIDAAGRPLDGNGPVRSEDRLPVERPAPPIFARAPVVRPLQTGIKAVDAAIPVGRGQRQLILGDRQTGKTTIALDAILNQQPGDVVSVYCAIGQRGSAVARLVATLRAHDALRRSVVVVAGGEDPAGLQFVAPYAATSIAEHFMAQGLDVLIVYDDLTRHARAYRELSLLLRRPPGREAYPGDIFHIHSRLLERATRLRKEAGGGSLTALPIIETQAQNISAYIPTNLISITDGQIYLSPDLFRKGHLPAIDIGRSVSRVGSKAQPPAYRDVAQDLRLAYAQFEELETFSRFGTRLDDETVRRLERGRRVREVLRQHEHDAFSLAEQLLVLMAATEGLLDPVPLPQVGTAEAALRKMARTELAAFGRDAAAGGSFSAEERLRLLQVGRHALGPFQV